MTNLNPISVYTGLKVARHFRREFARVSARAPAIRIRQTNAGNPPKDVLIERRGQQFSLVIEKAVDPFYAKHMCRKICAYAYWLSLCPPEVKQITVNASDGETVSNARFAPSVRFPQHVALPDPYFFQDLGFADDLEAGKSAPCWEERSDDIAWRGRMNGCGWISFAPEDVDNQAVLQRMRMVLRLQGMAGTDVRFVGTRKNDAAFALMARQSGFVAEPIPPQSWLGRKFAIDIDGFANTWSNLLVRMLYGCCVLKVETQFGFRQWYYDELKPFEHYVPVCADMTDFAEKIEWVRTHDTEAKAIARRGQALARALTFKTQAGRAATLIEQHWDSDSQPAKHLIRP
ncbi:glycosyl transferase family 90 [Rhizobium setariae]|nr:glycosyl transferase family 90 [Rhizobium setariae]